MVVPRGTDKDSQQEQDCLSLPSFVPNFKILGQAVPEKSLTKKFTHRNTNTFTEKAKTIYPLYTSYTGGINTDQVTKRVGYESQGPSRAAELKIPSSRFFQNLGLEYVFYIRIN